MRRLTTLVVVAVVGLTFAAPAAKEPAKISSPLVGKWRLVTLNGEKVSARGGETLTFRADGVAVRDFAEIRANGGRPVELGYEVDATTDPPRLDYLHFGDKPTMALFWVEGDTLTICEPFGRGQRPKQRDEAGALLHVYERVKPKD